VYRSKGKCTNHQINLYIICEDFKFSGITLNIPRIKQEWNVNFLFYFSHKLNMVCTLYLLN